MPTRTDMAMPQGRGPFLILAIIFTILSIAGILLYFNLDRQSTALVAEEKTPESTPTMASQPIIMDMTPSSFPSVKPSPLPTPSLKPTSSSVSPTTAVDNTPTPSVQSFSSEVDKFSVIFKSDRKLYQDTESSGNRYTFYKQSGNFAVHTGTSWSWIHPGRQFNPSVLVASQPSFRYDIATQTIIDIEKGDQKYTLQCIHNGVTSLKSECEEFINSFKLL